MAKIEMTEQEKVEIIRLGNDIDGLKISISNGIKRLTGNVRQEVRTLTRAHKALQRAHRIIANQADIEGR